MPRSSFSAIVVDRQNGSSQSAASITEFADPASLPNQAGELLIRVTHSSLNYKDGLAVTGRGKILRAFPIVPGIDLAGVVAEADDQGRYKVGDSILATGWGIGERVSGGYSGFARVKKEWVVPVPQGLKALHCMAIGTAGLTAMQSMLALEDHGVLPDSGPVLVSGAAGGVGSIAILILAKRGYKVVASSGRAGELADYLKDLGASELMNREALSQPSGRPLESQRWAGAIDTVGGETLASILRQTKYRGSVTACGLAGGANLPSTVLPFILRGVNLLGIDSAMCPFPVRERAWNRLAQDLDVSKLEELTQVIPLKEVPDASKKILAGKVRGRIVVDIGR